MALTVAQLATYVGASPDEAALTDALSEATTLVDDYLGVAGRQSCPDNVKDLAVKQLGSELWARRNSPGGISQWGPDGQPVRLARDPLTAVRPLLWRYRGFGTVG